MKNFLNIESLKQKFTPNSKNLNFLFNDVEYHLKVVVGNQYTYVQSNIPETCIIFDTDNNIVEFKNLKILNEN